MVSKQHGLKKSIAEIREIAGTDKMGTNALGMIKAAEKLGFAAKGVKGNREALLSEFPLPAIAHMVVDGGLLHYVVIHKITASKIVIADPGKGIVTYGIDKFCAMWTGVLILLSPTSQFERGGSSSHLFRFFKLLAPQKRLIFFIFLSSLLITVFGIAGSFYFRAIMDTIVPGSLVRTLTTISIGLIVLYAFKALVELFRGQLMLYLSQKLDIPLILGYYQHVLALPMGFFGSRRVGEIVSRFMDASKIREAISGATLTVLIDSLMAIIGGIVLFTQNQLLFAIALAMVVLYGIVVFSFNRPIRSTNEKQMEGNAQLTSYLVESLNGIDTVKAHGAEREVQLATDRHFVQFLRDVFKGGTLHNVQGTLTGAIAAIGETVILWIGATLVIDGKLTFGELITFNALLVYFIDPIKNLINLQPQLQTAFVAASRLGEIMDLEPERDKDEDGKIKPCTLREDISLNGIRFRYGTRKPVLNDISLTIPSGSTIALVGESGSGKTSLAKLLLKFYEWEQGEILFGKTNAKDISIDALRERIAYVSQETFFFSGSIKDNLSLGLEDVSLEDIVAVCETTGASEFINELPLRYDTHLQENAANLSGGQRQRLALVRALLRKPDVLILDEATSNLDSIAEQTVQDTIERYAKNVTTLVIAHRLSTVTRCDLICVLEDGSIIEQGTHSELIARKGRYYDLWSRQIPDTAE